MIGALFQRDLRLAMRRPADVLTPIGFFLIIATLFPLAIGPSPELLTLMRSAILWIAVLLASLPSFERLYQDDYHQGLLDRLIMARTPLWEYALTRIASHIVIMGIPFLATLPIIALFFGIELVFLPLLAMMVALGLTSLTLLGSMAASLTLGARQSSVLSAVLILPLAFPILIFGTMATHALLTDNPYHQHLALLGAVTCLFLVLSPAATFYALRIATEER